MTELVTTTIRLTPEQHHLIRQGMAAAGCSYAPKARELLLAWARETLAQAAQDAQGAGN